MENNQSDFFTNQISAPKPLSVSQLTSKVKGLLEMEVGEVWVKGEISGFKTSAAGHVYFSLKDEFAVVSCALFKGSMRQSKKFNLEDGIEVLVHGKISVYAPRGNYQLIIDHVEPVGAGALQLAFEQLKSKLLKEGLFDQNRKKPIPPHPSRITVITSPTGAALQDILNVLNRRNIGLSVLVIPTLVQGDEAPLQIVDAIQIANLHQTGDVIILARGGGSIEDLWSFNDERVVRAVADSEIPIISAIGHEVDFTLCDFVSDLRAPTPSAAAELVSKSSSEISDQISHFQKRMMLAIVSKISKFKSVILQLENQMISPAEKLHQKRKLFMQLELRMMHAIDGIVPQYRQMVDDVEMRIQNQVEKILIKKKNSLSTLSSQLEALSPLKVLGRGYTLIEDVKSKKIIKSLRQVKKEAEIEIKFVDGNAKAKFI